MDNQQNFKLNVLKALVHELMINYSTNYDTYYLWTMTIDCIDWANNTCTYFFTI